MPGILRDLIQDTPRDENRKGFFWNMGQLTPAAGQSRGPLIPAALPDHRFFPIGILMIPLPEEHGPVQLFSTGSGPRQVTGR
jgi:hypothetical protein